MTPSLFKLAMQGEAIRGHSRPFEARRFKLYRRTEWLLPRSCGGLRYEILRKITDDLMYEPTVCVWYSRRAERKLSWVARFLSTLSTPQYSFRRVTNRTTQLIKRVWRSRVLRALKLNMFICKEKFRIVLFRLGRFYSRSNRKYTTYVPVCRYYSQP
jgi:hypothetical protein